MKWGISEIALMLTLATIVGSVVPIFSYTQSILTGVHEIENLSNKIDYANSILSQCSLSDCM